MSVPGLKKANLYAIVAALTTVVAPVATAFATPTAPASRYASIVVDAETGAVLYERNADLPRHPASLTKIMTLYLAFEALAQKKLTLTDELPVSSYAAGRDPSRLDLAPGSRLKVEDAIRGMTTKSANDAACILGEALGGGSETRFAERMTGKAKALGLKQTKFVNASGLPDEGHISSARDLALLSRALIQKYPDYYHYFALETFQFHGTRFQNQNRFLQTYYGADGIKTGFVNASGHNLAASAVRGGKRLIAIVLGGDTQAWTREHATRLLDVSYAKIDPSLVMVASNAVNSAAAEEAAEEAAEAATGTGSTSTPSVTVTASVSVSASVNASATATGTSTTAAVAATTAPAAVAPAAAASTGSAPPPATPATNVATAAAPPASGTPPIALPNATANLTAYVAASTAPKLPAGGVAPSATAPAPAAAPAATPAASLPKPAVTASVAAPAEAGAPASSPRNVRTDAPATVTRPAPAQPAAIPANGSMPVTDASATRPVLQPALPTPIAADRPPTAVVPSAPPKSSPAPPPAAASAEPAPTNAANAAPAVVEKVTSDQIGTGGDWSVQVGLFRDATVARRRGEEARQQMPRQLRGADLVVGRALDGVHVTSRLSRLSEQDARAACNELQRGRVPCVVVPPGRPLVVATN